MGEMSINLIFEAMSMATLKEQFKAELLKTKTKLSLKIDSHQITLKNSVWCIKNRNFQMFGLLGFGYKSTRT